ncbi:hypothetical protein N8198_02820 [Gammaproteobacteria bacterium]|nr:hypothetical protein [Gammaproteobacteria bacterium]
MTLTGKPDVLMKPKSSQSVASFARAYVKAVNSHRIARRNEPFPVTLFEIMQAPVKKGDSVAQYLKLIHEVVVPEARKLANFNNTAIYHAALGVDAPCTLLPFASSLLLMVETRKRTRTDKDQSGESGSPVEYVPINPDLQTPLTNKLHLYWLSLSDRLRADVEIARGRQLKRLRFLLMANPILQFLASATLKSAGEAGIDLIGWGATRIGSAGYSHFGREIVLFALLEQVSGGGFLDSIANLENPVGSEVELTSEELEMDALINYVLTPIVRDLVELVRKQYFSNRDDAHASKSPHKASMDGNDESGEDIDPAETAHAQKETRYFSDLKEKESAEARMGGGDEKENTDDPGIAETNSDRGEEKPKHVLDRSPEIASQNIGESGRRSQRLFEADTDLIALYRAVCSVIEKVESTCKSNESVIATRMTFSTKEGRDASFAELFRLWFAIQLLSLFKAQKYSASQQDLMFEDLTQVLSPYDDPDTSHALAVGQFLGKAKKQIFGERFVSKRKEFIEGLKIQQEAETVGENFLEILEQHLEALQTYDEMIGAVPSMLGNDASSFFSLARWLSEIRARNLLRQTLLEPGVSSEVESLWATLSTMMKADPYQYIGEGFECMALVFELIDLRAGTSRSELQTMRTELEKRFSRWGWKEIDSSHEATDAYFGVKVIVTIISNCLVKPDVSESLHFDTEIKSTSSIVDVKQTLQFFKMKYAPSQGAGEQNRWLYVAYKVSQTKGFGSYRRIFERVSNYSGEWAWLSAESPESGSFTSNFHDEGHDAGCKKSSRPRHLELSKLYAELLESDDWHEQVRKPIEALFSDKGEIS